MEDLLKRHVKKSSAGLVAAFIDQGKIEYFAYGTQAIGEDKPVNDETIFEIGSVTKVFTTTALVKMVNEGKIQLDDPIDLYLPGVKSPQFGDKKITLLHLATHTSGLPPVPDNLDLTNVTNPYQSYTKEKLYEFLSGYELQKAPGEDCVYSNLGMGLLGHILSLVSGKSFEELVRKSVCDILGMANTGIALTPAMKDHLANGHSIDQSVGPWDFDVLAGAGALRSNVKDMTLFLAANMGIIKTPLFETLKQCHQEQRSFPGQGGMALGWQVTNGGIIQHGGGTGGFLSFIGFNPKNQKGLVLLSNSTDFFSDDLTIGLLDPENYIPEKPIDEALTTIEYLKQFEGAFEAISEELPLTINFGLYGRDLWVWMSSGEKAVLTPVSVGVFRPRGAPDGYYTSFSFDGNQKVVKVQLIRPDGVIEACLKTP